MKKLFDSSFSKFNWRLDVDEIDEQLQFWDEPEKLRLYHRGLEYKNTNELIKELDTLTELLKKEPVNQLIRDKLSIVQMVICDKIGVGFNFELLFDMLDEYFRNIEKTFKNLDDFKNHNHETIYGLYTSRAKQNK
jgi:hypothetical protein